MTTPHQPENGYENATDEEKKTMMLKIAKDANAEQKAMFEPEKQPWKLIREDQVNQTWRHEDKGERLINKELLSFILKEEQCCLCKDKGVIELIEEAVEAERARIREEIEKTDAMETVDSARLTSYTVIDETTRTKWVKIDTILNLPSFKD